MLELKCWQSFRCCKVKVHRIHLAYRGVFHSPVILKCDFAYFFNRRASCSLPRSQSSLSLMAASMYFVLTHFPEALVWSEMSVVFLFHQWCRGIGGKSEEWLRRSDKEVRGKPRKSLGLERKNLSRQLGRSVMYKKRPAGRWQSLLFADSTTLPFFHVGWS